MSLMLICIDLYELEMYVIVKKNNTYDILILCWSIFNNNVYSTLFYCVVLWLLQVEAIYV